MERVASAPCCMPPFDPVNAVAAAAVAVDTTKRLIGKERKEGRRKFPLLLPPPSRFSSASSVTDDVGGMISGLGCYRSSPDPKKDEKRCKKGEFIKNDYQG